MLCEEQVFPSEVPKEPSSSGISLLTPVRSRWPYCSWQVSVQFYRLESIPVLHQALNFSNFQCDSEFRLDTESAALVYTYTYVNLELTAHRFYVCLVVFVAFQQYGLPSFTSLLSDVISFSAGMRCLNCRGTTDYTYAYVCKYGCVLCCKTDLTSS